jgi:hypothetical protein
VTFCQALKRLPNLEHCLAYENGDTTTNLDWVWLVKLVRQICKTSLLIGSSIWGGSGAWWRGEHHQLIQFIASLKPFKMIGPDSRIS